MNDLEFAKEHLLSRKLSLSIVKDGKVLFETNSSRISGFIGAIDKLKGELSGASVADQVAGKAIALLCVYVGVRGVYAEVLSKKAQSLFEQYKVSYQYKELVDTILDVNMTGVCPFEKLAADISNPEEAYPKFKALLDKMKACK